MTHSKEQRKSFKILYYFLQGVQETISRLLQDNHRKQNIESGAREEVHDLNTRNIPRENKKIQAMYVQSNMEARSCNHCCYVKAICNTYSECGFVALGIKDAMRHVVICGLPPFYNIFPHYLINGTILEKNILNMKCVC
jgi:hypothetical protein